MNISSSILLEDTNDWFFSNCITKLLNAYGENFKNLGADIPISHVNPFSKKPVDDVPGDYSPKQKTKKKSKKSYYKNDRLNISFVYGV